MLRLPSAIHRNWCDPAGSVTSRTSRLLACSNDICCLYGWSIPVPALDGSGNFEVISLNVLPHRGIPEGAVACAAHCSLANFWHTRLGKDAFTAYQASRRGGTVDIRILGDRVILTGQDVTVLRGMIVRQWISEQISSTGVVHGDHRRHTRSSRT